jgi:protein-S-isoprenylcysteine O-methyltransferase Ste14
MRRMHHEERVLGQAFPEYASYAARTPKFLPRLANIPAQRPT